MVRVMLEQRREITDRRNVKDNEITLVEINDTLMRIELLLQNKNQKRTDLK